MQEKKLQGNMPKKKPAKPKAEIAPSEKPKLPEEAQKELNDALLHYTVEGDTEEIKRLLKAGADITAKNKEGWTALHWAAARGHNQICIFLIEQYVIAGGDVKKLIAAKDYMNNKTAHDFARGKTAKLLESIEKLSEDMEKESLNSFIISFGECLGV